MQLVPDARVGPQLFANTNDEALLPVKVMPEMVWLDVPVFIRATNREELVLPTPIVPNDRLPEETAITVGLTPVPVRAIDCGEPAALSLTVIAAVIGPKATGVKCPWIVQLAPAARLFPQVFAKTNEDAFAPVTWKPVIDNGAVLLFVSDTN